MGVGTDSGVSGVRQWYPDSDKLLVKDYSDGKNTLYLFSTTGDMSELISGSEELDGIISPDGHIFTICQNASSGAYDISPLVGFYRVTLEEVTHWAWIENDLLFTTNEGVSILNTSTNAVQDVLQLSNSPNMIGFDASGYFISIDNYVVEIGGQGRNVTMVAGNDSNRSEITVLQSRMHEQPEVNPNVEPSGVPAFTADFAFMGLLFALFIIHKKRE